MSIFNRRKDLLEKQLSFSEASFDLQRRLSNYYFDEMTLANAENSRLIKGIDNIISKYKSFREGELCSLADYSSFGKLIETLEELKGGK